MLWRASGGRRCASRLPAICETRGTPYLSRRIWPMMLGGFPSLESLRTRASISSGSYLNQEGERLLTGRVEPRHKPLSPVVTGCTFALLFKSLEVETLGHNSVTCPWQN